MSDDPLAATAVVVAAHRRPEALAALLDALAGAPLELTVVNAGDDAGVRAAAAARPGVRLVPGPNEGYAAAVNRGVRGVTRAITVFTNDDVVAPPQALRVLAGALLAGAADVALPRLVDPRGRDEGTVRALPTPGRILLEWAVTPDRPPAWAGSRLPVQKWRRPRAPEDVAAGTAATVAVRTALLAAEPLPEAYFLYWEELEWFWRLRARGARTRYFPEAEVTHAGARALLRPESARLLARNAVRCVRRTQGRAAALRAFAAVQLWQARLLAQDATLAALGSAAARGRLPARLAGAAAGLAAWREAR